MVFYVRSSVDFHELGNLTRCAAILSTKLLDLFDSHFGKRFFGVPVQNLSRLARFTKGSSWVLCWLCWNRYSRRCHSTKKGTLVFFSMGLSAHIRQTPKRGWLVSPKRQDGKTLFLKKILRPEGYVHRSNSLDPISQPAAQLVVILPYIFALGVLWVLILFLAEPMSFQKMGWKKKSWSQPFYARILMVLPIATGKLEHTFQIGGTWIDRGFSMISMLNPPNLWHIMTYLGMAILQQVVPSLARSSGSLREVLDDPSLHCVVETSVNTESTPHSALCHPEHPRTRWPNVKWSDQNIPSVLVMFENFCSKACPWPKEAPKGPKAQRPKTSPHHHGRNTT